MPAPLHYLVDRSREKGYHIFSNTAAIHKPRMCDVCEGSFSFRGGRNGHRRACFPSLFLTLVTEVSLHFFLSCHMCSTKMTFARKWPFIKSHSMTGRMLFYQHGQLSFPVYVLGVPLIPQTARKDLNQACKIRSKSIHCLLLRRNSSKIRHCYLP